MYVRWRQREATSNWTEMWQGISPRTDSCGALAATMRCVCVCVCELVESCHILQTNVTNYYETFVAVYPISYCLGGRVIVIRLLAKAKVFSSTSNSSDRIWRLHDAYSKVAEGFSPRRLNWKEREDGYLPTSGAEVKNDWCRCLNSPVFVNDVHGDHSNLPYWKNIHI